MKVTSYAVARPAFYDRAAAGSIQNVNTVVSPHNQTTRFTYTVPAGRKANVENMRVFISRQTVATVSSTMVCGISSGGIELKYLSASSNTLSNPYSENNPVAMTLFTADVMTGFTIDISTGGTVQFVIQTKAMEYDA